MDRFPRGVAGRVTVSIAPILRESSPERDRFGVVCLDVFDGFFLRGDSPSAREGAVLARLEERTGTFASAEAGSGMMTCSRKILAETEPEHVVPRQRERLAQRKHCSQTPNLARPAVTEEPADGYHDTHLVIPRLGRPVEVLVYYTSIHHLCLLSSGGYE